MTKILYFYPHKFEKLTDGIHTRIVTILEYFRSRDFLVDMVSYENDAIGESFLIKNKLVHNIYYARSGAGKHEVKSNYFVQKARAIYRRLFIARSVNAGLPDLANGALIEK